MVEHTSQELIAFAGSQLIAGGPTVEVGLAVKRVAEAHGTEPIVVLDAATSRPVDLDLEGSEEQVRAKLEARARGAARAAETGQRGPGRPRLGVVSREVTLLPRHWEWLGEQPGGASAALRRLVEEARRSRSRKEQARRSQEAAFRFMNVVAGDLPGFEEAARSLYRRDWERLDSLVGPWPQDVRDHARRLIATVRRDEAAAAEPAGGDAANPAGPGGGDGQP